ncbi:hypothetical protein ATK36_1251 [Amycolatopsis sulphurea]|uniref:Uncharacterized protein n=1 Tax=Amycolatopsis sulphurea TaxID=76022 RepID=A0A2A9FI70_9PSEU|nr:hypothetical protein [Amycolatopsis sulphurea]PFG51074.1 hypothetical protein ATK36_6347 [Amycolatopsis sulphurea]PFG57655.1 hypothetical protein ATK36_1251 [Amycolatopsis sulphurea]
MSSQLDSKITELDKAMRKLREAMTTMPNRVGGFKKEHDEAARKVAAMTTTMEAAKPLFSSEGKRGPRARRR